MQSKDARMDPKDSLQCDEKAVTQLGGTVLITHSLTGLPISWERLIAKSFVTDASFPTCMAVLLLSSLLAFFHDLIFPNSIAISSPQLYFLPSACPPLV